MDLIDILIPGTVGLLLLLRPTAMFKPSGDAAADAKKTKFFRAIGGVLLGVAALYFVIRLLSRS